MKTKSIKRSISMYFLEYIKIVLVSILNILIKIHQKISWQGKIINLILAVLLILPFIIGNKLIITDDEKAIGCWNLFYLICFIIVVMSILFAYAFGNDEEESDWSPFVLKGITKICIVGLIAWGMNSLGMFSAESLKVGIWLIIILFLGIFVIGGYQPRKNRKFVYGFF